MFLDIINIRKKIKLFALIFETKKCHLQCFLVANDNFSVIKFDYYYFFPCTTSILAFILVIWFGLIFPIMSLNILDTA